MARRVATTTFVGRERELAALEGRLAEGERLVTLLGPGGIGKTRLARRLAEGRAAAFFCDLVDVRSGADVVLAACRALGLRPTGDDLVDQVGRALAEKGKSLFVLDNVEDLVADVRACLERWLVLAPEATFVATSRVAIRLPEEVVHEVGPLPVPRSEAELATSDAARLWVDRVTRVRGDYDLAADDPAIVIELLRRLDGHPLAIELAASRSRTLRAEDLLQRLEDRFALLSADGRTWDRRHATLVAVIASSWDALGAREQAALAKLTVLGGEFPLDAAEAVLGAGALDLIDVLRDRALLTAPSPGRLGTYESVRDFAAARLGDADRAAAIQAHATAFGARAMRWLHTHPTTPEARDARDAEVAAERANLLAVAERAAAGEVPAALAVYCLAAADTVHPIRDPGPRFVGLLDAVTTRATATDDASVAAGWSAWLRGSMARREGRYSEARPFFERAIALAAQHQDRELEAEGRVMLATVLFLDGLLDRAELEVNAVIASAGAPVRGRAYTLLGQVRGGQHRFREARVALERAVEWLMASNPSELAFGYLNLAETYMDLGDLEAAAASISRAAEIARRLGDRRLGAWVANMTGWHAIHRAAYGDAIAIYEDAIASLERSDGANPFVAHLEGWIGLAHLLAGRPDEAVLVLTHAVEHVRAREIHGLLRQLLAAARALAEQTTEAEWSAEVAAIPHVSERSDRIAEALAALVRLTVGSTEGLPAALTASEAILATPRDGSIERFLARSLGAARAARAGDVNRVRVARDGAWFARGDAAPVDLKAQPLMMKILAELVAVHARDPEATRSIDELFAVGWPGERASAASIEDRVRAVVKRLRRAGLSDLIETRAGGFRLVPTATIALT